MDDIVEFLDDAFVIIKIIIAFALCVGLIAVGVRLLSLLGKLILGL